ncbi:Uu.00g134760.m01.CDS01 [Anthostomella pinea]|uniref:Uu.00g134760.m01.CDS01 n=1 Tax=Anthostomella pinea TaxID=933095 RepID=A0AAI8VP31_9PEZI|nr:Uu.00g134760.m01.CDS01 [Anthostomella pinea]
MEKTTSPRPATDTYQKVSLSDTDLEGESPRRSSSDEGTPTPTWDKGYRRRKPRTILSTIWLFARALFIIVGISTWAASLWVVHEATGDMERARSLLLLAKEATAVPSTPHANSHDSSSSSSKSGHKITNPHHDSLNTMFIPGGTLPVAGYGLAYNTTYCNGWTDPAGAIERGCVLDPLQGGWVHELCHDAALTKEWLSLPDFGWYLDAERTHKVPQDRVWAADIPGGVDTTLYTVLDFHAQHCKSVMTLRIKHTTRRNKGLGYLPLDPGHMNHCIHLMTETPNPKELTQVVLGKFGGGTEGFGLAGECYMPIL